MLKKLSVELICGILFSVIGITFICLSVVFWIINNEFFKTATPVDASIVTIETYYNNNSDKKEHDVYVEYEYDGEKRTTELNYYLSGMNVGDRITLYCDPATHIVKSKNGSFILELVFAIMGGIFAAIGIPLIVLKANKKKNIEMLISEGQMINARITNVYMNYNYSVNGRHPYKLECEYTDPNGQQHKFVSGNIWTDPSSYLGADCSVYINPNNPQKYYVDIRNF